MQILLVRHGARAHQELDPDDHLTDVGRGQVCDLERALALRNLRPSVYLTSTHAHARETAGILAKNTGGDVIGVEALTSPSRGLTRIFEDLLNEAKNQMGIELEKSAAVALVSHEPALSRLVTRLTGDRVRPFNGAEALCIKGTWKAFLNGKARVKFRCPVTNYQEEEFREKLVSKMQVSTLLAGFTFTALIELVKEYKPLGRLEVFAVTSLTAALALFVASVYLYDRMAMPVGFWLFGNQPRRRRKNWSERFLAQRQEHGPLYTHMVRIWAYVFTPGVWLGITGFLAILLRSRNPFAVGGCLLAIFIVVLWYLRNQPPLGSD